MDSFTASVMQGEDEQKSSTQKEKARSEVNPIVFFVILSIIL